MRNSPKNSGWIEVICGPMFSGKTEELIRRLIRAKIAKQNVTIIKPALDNRYSEDYIVSHNQRKIKSVAVNDINDIKKLDPKTTPNPLSQNEIIDLPILKVNENDLINIKNGELMNNDLFKTKETYILEYDGNVVATYVPFNEKYFKPDKVII